MKEEIKEEALQGRMRGEEWKTLKEDGEQLQEWEGKKKGAIRSKEIVNLK